jgi:hypothetical protein
MYDAPESRLALATFSLHALPRPWRRPRQRLEDHRQVRVGPARGNEIDPRVQGK